ncbi:MAG: hypothetical protein GY946_31150 [bacterium]|nr:hypothetical protein [bacterium]
MFIPRYWSEASHLERYPDRRQVTVRRFGWSATSQGEADVHARQRVEEALAVLREGGTEALRGFTRRERRVAYSGSDGLPIREEIVFEHPDADVVVTRNSYGALCLNTTSAMFVDIDDPGSRAAVVGCAGGVAGALLGAIAGPLLMGTVWWLSGLLGAIALAWLSLTIARAREERDLRRRDVLAWAIERTRAWCESHPGWRVCAYETPAGVRLLPVHACFDAGDESSFAFMAFVEADPLYQRMCRLQKCFRARVSPKPWRAGVEDRFRAGGTWPVRDPAKLRAREDWVRAYERRAGDFASCRFAATVGEGRTDPGVERIRQIHDEMCQAGGHLSLA